MFALLFSVLAAGCTSPEPPNYACEGCTVTLDRITTLGDDSVDGIWGPVRWTRQDTDGRIYVRADLTGPDPFVFAADGRFLERLEADSPITAVIPMPNGDLYTVATSKVGGAAELRSVTHPTADAVRLPFGVDEWPGIAVFDESFVACRPAKTGEPTLARIGLDGRLLSEFGPVGTGEGWPEQTRTERVLAPAQAGGTWAAAVDYSYRIERWAADGSLADVIEPKSSWFEPYSPDERKRWGARPSVVGMWEDSHVLWIVGLAVDPGWDPSGRSNAELLAAGESLFPEQYDVVVEGIDPRTGDVRVSQRFPDLAGFPQVLAPGVVGIPRRVDPGFWQIDVLRVSAELD